MFKPGRLINQLKAGLSRENSPVEGEDGSSDGLSVPISAEEVPGGDCSDQAGSGIDADVLRITDYTDGEDRLLIGYDPAEIASPSITVSARSDMGGNYAVVFLNGRAVCRVDGLVPGATIAVEDIALVDIATVPETIEPNPPVALSA